MTKSLPGSVPNRMSLASRFSFTCVVILSWVSYRCEAQTFVNCFNGVFVPCTSKKCAAKATVQNTISACTKVTAAVVRQCTSNAFLQCASKSGAKTTYSCNKAVSNYQVNTSVTREKNACIAMKTPCQELMACTACGQNTCTAPAPVKPPTNAPVKPPTNAPVKPPTKAPVKTPTKAPVKSPTRTPIKQPTASPLKVTGDTSPPGNVNDCTTTTCQQRATCCTKNGGTLRSGGCINCLPTMYGAFYRCGFCDSVAFPGNAETCASFSAGSQWLTCQMASGDTCNVQHCTWSGQPEVNACTSTC